MAVGEWLAVAALAVAVVAIPVAIWATRRWGNRRARVEFQFMSLPLLPSDAREGLLEVTYRDVPVKDPHLVSVTLRNTGPKDISTSTFDSDCPIVIRFDQTFYGLTSVQGGVNTVSPAIGARATDSRVELRPGLLKRGNAWSFSAVLSGPVEVKVDSPLIDTDVREADWGNRGLDIVVRLSGLGIVSDITLSRRDRGAL